jgi:hypothetical protein
MIDEEIESKKKILNYHVQEMKKIQNEIVELQKQKYKIELPKMIESSKKQQRNEEKKQNLNSIENPEQGRQASLKISHIISEEESEDKTANQDELITKNNISKLKELNNLLQKNSNVVTSEVTMFLKWLNDPRAFIKPLIYEICSILMVIIF